MLISGRTASLLLTLSLVETACAGDLGNPDGRHKYWVCGVTSYQSVIAGKTEERHCRANTAYSEPPCREFFVEYEGTSGVRPGVPWLSPDTSQSQVRIEMTSVGEEYLYSHTVVNRQREEWRYAGKCRFYEAAIKEKIYMDQGLKTGRDD